MREDITSIPVSEVFEERDGCPICRMRDLLEARVTDYITGAAMMEPDVRIETNRQGFCIDHYRMMLKKRNRLGMALTLESRLAEVEKQVFSSVLKGGKGKSAGRVTQTCFVCGQVDWAMERMLETVCRLWEREEDFRRLFAAQPALCLPHYARLAAVAADKMNRKSAAVFAQEATDLCRRSLRELQGDVSHFCKMFDYRNGGADADWGNSRDAVERSVRFLTSREP